MTSGPIDSSALQRGLILIQQGRFSEAEDYLLQAVAADPEDHRALALLATCQYHADGKEQQALLTIDRTLALAPLEEEYHALRAWILVALRRPREALLSAAEALRQDPTFSRAHTARAAAYMRLEDWTNAEKAARRALEFDPEDADAANLLGETLRIQGRREETAAQIGARLARDPLDPRTHASAGWAALQRGERAQAEEHFVEALRLDPNQEWARNGLVQAFKARSPLYRGYLRYAFATARLSQRSRWGLIVGLYVGARLLRTVLGRAGMLVAALYLLFVLWSFLAPGLGNFLLLLDRRARLALKRAERWEGLTLGVAVLGGILLLAAGLVTKRETITALGMGLAGSAVPFSLTFSNESEWGRALFGVIAGFTLLVATLNAVCLAGLELASPEVARALGWTALVLVMASTWLANVRALHR